MRARFLFLVCWHALVWFHVSRAEIPVIATEPQPFLAATRQVVETAAFLGSPFTTEETAALQQCIQQNDAAAVEKAQRILDARVLFLVTINPEQRVKVSATQALPKLDEAGWHQYLVKVVNEAGTTAALKVSSPEAGQVFFRHYPQPGRADPPPPSPPLSARWLDVQMWDAPPMRPTLSGLNVEYRMIGLYSRDAGKRDAKFHFDVGQGTQDLGFRGETNVLFDCLPAHEVTLRVKDENGEPCMAAFTFTDAAGRVYPSQFKRLAPDFGFQQQIYREDGEKVKLPHGAYHITFQRGPESLPEKREVTINAETKELAFQVKRWIDPAKQGWWSGDHHIHAAGCAHYTSPTEGVHAPDMARHCQGEDLKIGANLTWGPCFDYQKQFFSGKEDKTSQYPFLLRYDIEVSGFGSHKSGHLCLLRLKDQMYPGGDSSKHWPTLGLNTLRWAQKQGAVCGPAHSATGLAVDSNELPNYVIPPFDGIGANEYIVDVTHEVEGPDGKPVPAVDFMSTVDTAPLWELNIWYHTLNAGFRTRISGETDFPCIYGERVGMGRSYAKVDGRLTYDAWCDAIEKGRCYVSDGFSHLMEFTANGVPLGEQSSEVHLPKPGKVTLKAQVASLLSELPRPEFRGQKAPPGSENQKSWGRNFDAFYRRPYWHVERARIGDTREVPVEVIVNGYPVAKRILKADGTVNDLSFDVEIPHSSWVALRILPSAHTNPIFVMVDKKPIRASKRSVDWCLKCVDQCWTSKEPTYDDDEKEDARAAYEHARTVYKKRLAECAAE
ncbi:hypothetical protein DES53_103100 [Roseimicrobium gellanilyticum]|uniref:Uncharacterized protein n=1 Tax=Roseimicrobium gellanilyticum TaxID=748857 RepID=A0A366HPR4_9BACT|nr:CehA/McbA family metallohydrolase [Roseimicrobium gellanilyticum]RBP45104.1 hypothetical protein DES53_103100 [Roseimicrobium gellanilyticum]